MEMVIHEKRYIRRGHTESSAKSGGHPQRGAYTEEITHSGIQVEIFRTESVYKEVCEETATHRVRSQGEEFTRTVALDRCK